jgi:hypothetical protein
MLEAHLYLAGAEKPLAVQLHAAYGPEPDVAVQMLQLALLAAEWPTIMIANGQLLRFPSGSVERVYVRYPVQP